MRYSRAALVKDFELGVIYPDAMGQYDVRAREPYVLEIPDVSHSGEPLDQSDLVTIFRGVGVNEQAALPGET